jgi:2-iminobutanoate/2-iminopropanoate deaminase
VRVYESTLHPYSEIRITADGVAYVSGVLPYGENGQIVREEELAPETALAVLAQRLEAAGLTLADVVKTTVFVTDIRWRDAVNRAYLASFVSPMPARSVVEVRNLPQGSPIEIEAVAWCGRP